VFTVTELGNRLKEAREAKGLSLDDVQEMTKIQKRYLAGIEEGRYDLMPGKFYVRAFIKQYAEAVGLDAEEIFREYKNEIPESHEDEIPQRMTRIEPTSRRTVSGGASGKFFDYLPKIIVAAFIIGAIFLVWLLIPKGGGNEKSGNDHTVKVEQSKSVAPVKENTISKKKEAKKEGKPSKTDNKNGNNKDNSQLKAVQSNGRQTVYQLTNAKDFKISITTTGQSWIQVTDESGKSYFSNLLQKGQSQTFDLKGHNQAKIVVGFAPATVIKVNGQTVQYKIPANQVVRQDIVIQNRPSAQ
jgi:cytoskeletal protein RodZ